MIGGLLGPEGIPHQSHPSVICSITSPGTPGSSRTIPEGGVLLTVKEPDVCRLSLLSLCPPTFAVVSSFIMTSAVQLPVSRAVCVVVGGLDTESVRMTRNPQEKSRKLHIS